MRACKLRTRQFDSFTSLHWLSEEIMLKGLWRTCAFASCIVSASLPLTAQEVIHALTGTVISINNEAKTITVLQDSGSKAVFKEMSNPKTASLLTRGLPTSQLRRAHSMKKVCTRSSSTSALAATAE
jgi:hypothetical protein